MTWEGHLASPISTLSSVLRAIQSLLQSIIVKIIDKECENALHLVNSKVKYADQLSGCKDKVQLFNLPCRYLKIWPQPPFRSHFSLLRCPLSSVNPCFSTNTAMLFHLCPFACAFSPQRMPFHAQHYLLKSCPSRSRSTSTAFIKPS